MKKVHRTKGVYLLLLVVVFLIASLSGCQSSETSISSPDYSTSENWAIFPEDVAKGADVFLLCPTVDSGTETRYNMSLEDEKMKSSFRKALDMETGIYDEACNVFAPYYRQMTLSAYTKDSNSAYLDIAYQDVKAAFLDYFETYNQGRPFILAGFSQGSQLGIMLMEDLFDDPKYSEPLIAAYMLGWSVYEETIEKNPWIQMAEGETDTGCVISFNSESVETSSSFVVPAGKKSLAINPLNWKTDSTPADASQNLGACLIDYSGGPTKEVPHLTGAYLDHVRGTLKVVDVAQEDYPPLLPIFASGEYHLYDYQFFFRNLQENVTKRVAAHLAK